MMACEKAILLLVKGGLPIDGYRQYRPGPHQVCREAWVWLGHRVSSCVDEHGCH